MARNGWHHHHLIRSSSRRRNILALLQLSLLAGDSSKDGISNRNGANSQVGVSRRLSFRSRIEPINRTAIMSIHRPRDLRRINTEVISFCGLYGMSFRYIVTKQLDESSWSSCLKDIRR